MLKEIIKLGIKLLLTEAMTVSVKGIVSEIVNLINNIDDD